MPTYAYRCPDGHEFEAFHKMSEDGPKSCEVCKKRPVERVLFPVAVHFKGSGFYATDYGRGNRKRDGAKDDGSSAEGTSSSGESSGDKKGDGGSSDASSGSSGGSSNGKSESKTADA